jgi:hypothetical protein
MCYGFVSSILINLENNLHRIPDEMVNFLSTVMQSQDIEANCEHPIWLFTDLLIGQWIGPALTSVPLAHGLQQSHFESQDIVILSLSICRLLIEICFLSSATKTPVPQEVVSFVNGHKERCQNITQYFSDYNLPERPGEIEQDEQVTMIKLSDLTEVLYLIA